MKDRPRNLAQSVRDRLKTVAVGQRLDYNLVLTRYVLERLLFRLGVPAHRLVSAISNRSLNMAGLRIYGYSGKYGR